MNPEMVKELGTTRKRELQSAQKAVEVAKRQLAELQSTLAKHREGQAALAPATTVTAGAVVATLAQGLQLQSATSAVIDHLEQVAIPAAKAEVQRTARLLATQQDGILRKRAHIAEQQRVIAKAQAAVDAAAGWLAG
jgi:tRNA U55 pseudouridine synthase TruB